MKKKCLTIGIDEAGRGPLCGPVSACSLVLPEDFDISMLNDSKKLSEKQREKIYNILVKEAIFDVVLIDSKTIDEINILQATFLAMTQSYFNLLKKIDSDNIITIVDGNKLPEKLKDKAKAVVKADTKYPSVMAASIIAKVTRDHYMLDLDKKYPYYDFKSHKGYGTKKHYDAIKQYGLIDEHRRTFLKKLVL